MSRTRTERRYQRYVKGIRRIREDRAQHGNDHGCLCFERDAQRGRGEVFAYFADTPTRCSSYCCGNPRKHFGIVTNQEKRAPQVKDWDTDG